MSCQKQVSRAGTDNHSPQYLWDVIIWPCHWCLLLSTQSKRTFMFVWCKKKVLCVYIYMCVCVCAWCATQIRLLVLVTDCVFAYFGGCAFKLANWIMPRIKYSFDYNDDNNKITKITHHPCSCQLLHISLGDTLDIDSYEFCPLGSCRYGTCRCIVDFDELIAGNKEEIAL